MEWSHNLHNLNQDPTKNRCSSLWYYSWLHLKKLGKNQARADLFYCHSI